MNELIYYMVILSSYLISSITYVSSRWPSNEKHKNLLYLVAIITGIIGVLAHANILFIDISKQSGLYLSLPNIVSLIGLQLAIIAIISSLNREMCGFAAGILIISSLTALFLIWIISTVGDIQPEIKTLTWQIKTHVLSSLFAYGLLCAGAIIALFALVQDTRLRKKKISSLNSLFAPLETTEKILFNTASAGSVLLFISIFSGLVFIENLFSQHLAHKTVLSVTALIMFSILVYGRSFFGWRGRSAIYLYLSAFIMLAISYFGTRFILENLLGRSWS